MKEAAACIFKSSLNTVYKKFSKKASFKVVNIIISYLIFKDKKNIKTMLLHKMQLVSYSLQGKVCLFVNRDTTFFTIIPTSGEVLKHFSSKVLKARLAMLQILNAVRYHSVYYLHSTAHLRIYLTQHILEITKIFRYNHKHRFAEVSFYNIMAYFSDHCKVCWRSELGFC